MTVILCVGETLAERELGITGETVAKQVKVALHGLTADQVKNIVISIEPVWAIGTGKTATAEQAEEVCAFIRATVASLYDKAIADGMTIQYGGSMKRKELRRTAGKGKHRRRSDRRCISGCRKVRRSAGGFRSFQAKRKIATEP